MEASVSNGSMSREDAEEYTQALGQVVAGGWRQVALGKRLGVPSALGITVEEWVEDRLGGYVRMSIPDRRDAVAELSEEGMSTREIGDVLGVDQSTVVRDAHASAGPDKFALQPEPEPEPDAHASAGPTPAEKDAARKKSSTAKRNAKRRMSPNQRRIYNHLPTPLRATMLILLDLQDMVALSLNRKGHW